MLVLMCVCVCGHSSPSLPSCPFSLPALPSLPGSGSEGISSREVGSKTPERAAKQAMRGGRAGSASAAAPRGVNPFHDKRRALIRLLDAPAEVQGKVGSSRRARLGTPRSSLRRALSSAFVWERCRRRGGITSRALPGAGRTSSIPPPASRRSPAPRQPPPRKVWALEG